MRPMLAAFMLLLLSQLGGCAYSVHDVAISDYTPYGGGKKITAESRKFIIMGFVFDTAYADTAHKKLMDQCPRGEIIGIQTEFFTELGFFSWENVIRMQGTCLSS